MSTATKKFVCFVMFLDDASLAGVKAEGWSLDERNRIGLWRVVHVRNMPYSDPRKTGKVPKMLAHRLFPNAK